MLKFGKRFGLPGKDRGGKKPGSDRGRPARGSRPSKILAAKLLRARGRTIHWKHTAIYAALVLAVGAALAAWDRAYEAHQAAVFNPPPRVMAKNLVEGVIGPGTVNTISLDDKAGALDVTVEDVLTKAGQSRTEMQKNLTTEGSLVIQLIQAKLPFLKTITIRLVKSGKPLATARLGAGQKTPITEFASGAQ